MVRLVRTPLIVVGVLVLLVGALYFGAYTFARPNALVNLGTPIRQDDFTYTVTNARKASELTVGSRSIKARGIFYIVTVRLDNHAVRVPFEWDDNIVHLIDNSGHSYDISDVAQSVFDRQNSYRSVPAGDSASFEVVFDLPRQVQRPVVVFKNGILMGDAFDFVAY